MTLGERIYKARSEANLSKSALARCVGVSHTAAAQWEADETKSLQADNLFKIAATTGSNARWLQTGDGPQKFKPDPRNTIDELAGFYSVRAPIVGTAQLGPKGYWQAMDYPPGHGDGFVPVPSTDPDVYALRVKGDSMAPAIRHGWIVVMEPNEPIQPGEFILVCTTDELCMIKELRFERDNEYTFGSVNDDYPAITVDKTNITHLHAVKYLCMPSTVIP